MAIILTFVGVVLIVVGVLGTQGKLGSLLVGDLTGQRNFGYWLIAIFVVGTIGYVQKLRTFSDTFIALIIISMVLRNGGVFAQAQAAFQSGTAQSPGDKVPVPAVPSGGSSGGGSSGGGGLSGILSSFLGNTGAVESAVNGALSGGSAGGPVGAGVGGVIGAITSLF